jgi:uncharacterized damage-inducible protein DinB
MKEPTHSVTGAAARFSAYFDYYRSEIIDKVTALPDAELRTTRLGSGWTPIELLSHLVHMEQRWFVWGFLGEDVADPWGDWDVDEPWENDGGRWQVADDIGVDSLIDALQAVGQRTRGVLSAYPLDARAPLGTRFRDDPSDLEWICLHVLQEYARHTGHLDIVVELAGVQDGDQDG